MNLDESKCLASLAVFRELHDSKKDVYEIISEFLREIIFSNSKYQFNITEISQLLNETYDFKIPEAVIRSSLKKIDFLKKEQGFYIVEDISKLNNTSEIATKHSEIQINNENIINNLFDYISTQKDCTLTQDEKEEIVHAFCNFILDDSISNNFSEYISAFIVKNKTDIDFTKQLETIKEGVVLYSGIKYNSNLNEIGSWDTELTIFLDTEILFHFAGYNGEIYQQSFDDFNFFIKKINTSGRNNKRKTIIHLKYFKEVRYVIEGFFEKAIHIYEGQDRQNPSNSAMASILHGCKSISDIISKKTNFFLLLKNNGILEDEFAEYFSPENHKYNIEDKSLIESLSLTVGNKDIGNNLKNLNYVRIHRRGNQNNNLENIGHILVTGNSLTLNISWNEAIKPYGSVPLATTLDFLTNKFWFRLSRGFGADNYPKSFGVITKAQVLLSAELNKSVGKKYDELQKDYKSGKLTEEQALSTIIELRKRSKKPEEIHEIDLPYILESISEESIEIYIKEQELFKNKASREKDENIRLREHLLLKDNKIETQKTELETAKEKVKALEEGENIRIDKTNKRNRLIKKIFYTIFLFIIIYLGVSLYKIDKKIIGSSLSLIAVLFTILNFFGIDYRTFMNTYTKMAKKKIA